VDEKMASDAAAALVGTEVMATTGRAMLSVHCANIRDEAGIVGKIAESVMASGARIEQVGDSHDCILLVVESDRANDAAARLRADFGLDGDDAH
jgi:aspartokinase